MNEYDSVYKCRLRLEIERDDREQDLPKRWLLLALGWQLRWLQWSLDTIRMRESRWGASYVDGLAQGPCG